MSYQHERDEFIGRASKEGLDLQTITKLLKYAVVLQRLSVAQCNGDWPYNGDRDWPDWPLRERWDKLYTTCPKCDTSGVAKSAMRPSDGIWVKRGKDPVRVCPDCRTQELVSALLDQATLRIWPMLPKEHTQPANVIKAVFGGDPRGAVLRLSTPGYPYDSCGKNGANGLYVPAREK